MTTLKTFHPLDDFNDQQVFELLAHYFEQNCKLAGVPTGMGKKLVSFVWDHKQDTDYETLRTQSLEKLVAIMRACNVRSEEPNTLNLLDLSNAKTVIDLGANKLAAINFFGTKFPTIEKLIAIDIVPQQKKFQYPEKSIYIQVDPEAIQTPLESEIADVVHIQFVLHHLQTRQHIENMITDAHRLLKPEGRLIIWEETFTDSYNETYLQTAIQQNVLTNKEITYQFYELNDTQKKSFITALDWLINVGNPHMPWTGQYYSWSEWLNLIKPIGFSLQRSVNLGIRLNGKLKQGVHIVGEFTKN